MSEPYTHSRYIIICEGKSEKAYIQELNIYFREKCDIYDDTVLIPKLAGTGYYIDVAKEYKKQWAKDKNKSLKFYIWVDKDIYEKNDRGNMDRYKEKPEGIPDFSFNIFNFEDFLILHFPKEDFLKHRKLFEDEGHFKEPLSSEEYEPLIKQVFKEYKKGSLPSEIKFSEESLKNLFANNKNLPEELQNDFANELDNIIGEHFKTT
jgi:hypothetical protein